MLTFTPTPSGIGVEMTSTSAEMHQLYELIDVVLNINWEEEDGPTGTRGLMIQAFAYDIRHTFMYAEYAAQQGKLVPCSIKFIWPDIIIYLICLRQQAAYSPLEPKHLDMLDQLEGELKKAMYAYDPDNAPSIEHLVQPMFDLNNDYLFLIQHHLHNRYVMTKPRKTAFKKLSSLMHMFLDYTGIERQLIEMDAKAKAKEFNCTVRELRAGDEYMKVKKW